MSIILRQANKLLLPIMERFHQALIVAERPFGDTLAPDPISYYNLEDLLDNEDAEVVVAEVEGKVIGMGYAKIVESKDYHTHTHHCHLGCMFVEEEYRGKGINKMVMDYLMAWSKSRGIHEIRLEVYAQNESAIRAYEKCGFFPNMVAMRMKID